MGVRTTQRIDYLDVLRGIATILVIFIHVSSSNWYGYIGSTNWYFFSFYESISRFAVPIFFMISGAMLLSPEKEITFPYIFKKIFRMIIFLIFWELMYALFNQRTSGFDFSNIIQKIWEGNTQAHLWFVYSIIGLYLVTPVLKIFTKEASKKLFYYFLLLCFLLEALSNFQIPHLSFIKVYMNKINSCAFLGGGYIGYYVLGTFLDRYDIFVKKKFYLYALGILCSLLTFCLLVYDCVSTQTLSQKFLIYNSPLIVITSTAFFVFIKNNTYKNILSEIIKKISYKSFGIYAIHQIFITILSECGFSTFSFTGILSVPVIVAVVLSISYVSVTLISKIPILKKYIV